MVATKYGSKEFLDPDISGKKREQEVYKAARMF